MDWGILLRKVLLGLTLISCGGILWLSFGNLRTALRYKDWVPVFYALARLGLVVIVIDIGDLVYQQPRLTWEIHTIYYMVGIFMITGGYTGVALFGPQYPQKDGVGRRLNRGS